MTSTPEIEETPPPARRSHRGAVYALIAAGTISAFLAIAAIWISRQALETESWTNTSSQLLEDQEIRGALSAFLVDRLYAEVDVKGELQGALPPRAQPLAGPAAGALRDLAQRAADEALQRPRVQALWETANRTAHQQLLRVIEGGGENVSTENGAVTLNLGTVLQDLSDRTGVGGRAAAKLGPDSAQIEVLRSDQLGLAQDVANILKPLALVLTLLALALFGGAIALSGERRRETFRAAGVGFVVAGVLALLMRSLAGSAVVDALAKTESVRPAVESVWRIGTSMLVEVATASIIYGIAFIFAAWIAGPTRVAVGARRGLAPYLHSPAYAWGGLVTIAIVLLWWGPTPGLRRLVPAIVLLGLLALGMFLLRRQTAREFPDAPGPHLGASIRDEFERLRGSVSARRHPEAAPHSGNGAAAAAAAAARSDSLATLERLANLHDRGALTDEEFADRKRDALAAAS
jgi:hypothetical protein